MFNVYDNFFKINILIYISSQSRCTCSQVVTYKNHALDNFLKECMSSPDVKIVRVGTLAEDADKRLSNCLLREVCS